MKNKFLKTFTYLGVTSIMMISCQKKIDEAYTNPNALVIEPIESILPSVIGGISAFASSAGNNYGLQNDAILLGRYIQYWGTQTLGENYAGMGGAINSDNTGSVWATVYYGHGQNLNRIVQWGTEQQKWDYVGVALALRAWGWLQLTNQYGDAILKQAFNTSLQQFQYDTQAEFYDSCRAICFRSLDFLNQTGGGVSAANLAIGDAYFYNGDVNKWKKFVYGVLARSYNDLTNKADYTAKGYADSAIKYANLAMSSNADNATSKFAGGNINGLNSYYGPLRSNLGAIRQTNYISNLMTGLNTGAFTGVADPRAPYMLRENTAGTYKGFTVWLGASGVPAADYPQNFWGNATSNSTAAPTVNNSRYIFQNTAEYPIMTASEMQFILAESYLRKGNSAAALTAYSNGISLNFDMLTSKYTNNIPTASVITAASKAAYLSNSAVVPSAANLSLTQTLLQKYIALYGWGVHETWTDMRRFHYTDLDPKTGKQVYADFTIPSGIYLISTNNGKPVYRCRPRFNSEYLYNIPELTRLGALNTDYNTVEMWYTQK